MNVPVAVPVPHILVWPLPRYLPAVSSRIMICSSKNSVTHLVVLDEHHVVLTTDVPIRRVMLGKPHLQQLVSQGTCVIDISTASACTACLAAED